jgi:hypothetical protein
LLFWSRKPGVLSNSVGKIWKVLASGSRTRFYLIPWMSLDVGIVLRWFYASMVAGRNVLL